MESRPDPAAVPPYDVLAREHRLIERALDVLGRCCDDARRTKTLDAPVALQIIEFLRDFADRSHHLKEERILFPAIDAKGFFPGCGLVSEHQLARERVHTMAGAVERWSRGDATALKVFIQHARSYIGLLRAHIAKEDDCLARVTAGAFSGDERMRLVREFNELEARELGERVFERHTASVVALESKFGRLDPPSG